MLVQLGQRNTTHDVVDLLLECHVRIRRFLSLATQLGSSAAPHPDVTQQIAGQIRRYFVEAFPLHLADEDDLVRPALHGGDPQLESALAQMHEEHQEHAPLVRDMVALCESLQADPEQLTACATRLTELTATLEAALEPHLLREEREIFPALRALSQAHRDAIQAAMRERREAVLSATAQIRQS